MFCKNAINPKLEINSIMSIFYSISIVYFNIKTTISTINKFAILLLVIIDSSISGFIIVKPEILFLFS